MAKFSDISFVSLYISSSFFFPEPSICCWPDTTETEAMHMPETDVEQGKPTAKRINSARENKKLFAA